MENTSNAFTTIRVNDTSEMLKLCEQKLNSAVSKFEVFETYSIFNRILNSKDLLNLAKLCEQKINDLNLKNN